jgi:hypothetical protein
MMGAAGSSETLVNVTKLHGTTSLKDSTHDLLRENFLSLVDGL